jgi:AraC-like DNA-binding protein
VRDLRLEGVVNGADLAVQHGYYDQSHFIRDFKKRVRVSPQRYLEAMRDTTHFYNPSWGWADRMASHFNPM